MSTLPKTARTSTTASTRKRIPKSNSDEQTSSAINAKDEAVQRNERSAKTVQRRKELSQVGLSKQLGLRLKQLRIQAELSQEQLGGLAELDRTAIGAIESGGNPTIYALSVICRALNITLSEFLQPITLEMNIKPTWAEPAAVMRRANRATPERKSSATARGLR
jgi:transcriptional regulator with XRE-family HTH domain